MTSKKQFGLWGDEESSGAKPRASGTNLSGSRFSTRDYAVDQSVNLMAMGESQGTNLSSSKQDGGFASSVAGLFRSTTATEPPIFDEYGDAAPSTESEEYISDKQRRMTPVFASIRNTMGTKTFYVIILGIFGVFLLVGGIVMATNNKGGSNDEVAMREYIVEAGVTPSSVFAAGDSSPQSKALKWMVYDDPAKLKPGDKGCLDRYILAVFYYGSNDKLEGWNDNSNWMTGKGICSWAGVQCPPISVTATSENNFQTTTQSYDANEPITGFVLRSNNIEGTIPDEFGGFPEIMILDLSDNGISGSIPSTLGNLKKIRDLFLRKNSLFGTFPDELTRLTGLHQLHLGENNLEGSLPDFIEEMKNLRSLALTSNNFDGFFPFVQSLNFLINLHLDDNQFETTIPYWLYEMTDLSKSF